MVIKLPNCSGSSCQQCASHGLSEWGSLETQEVTKLNRSRVCNRYSAGQTIFTQGSPCLGVFCVQGGTVVTRRTDDEGNSVIVRLYHHGETFGYEAAFRDGAHSVTAEAVQDSQVCFIDRSTFDTLLDENPQLSRRFLQTTAKQMEKDEAIKLGLVASPLRVRLASLLLDFKEYYGQVDDEGVLKIDLPLSRQELAAMLGARPESISRAIRDLQQDEVATFDDRAVSVFDLDRLFDLVEGVDPTLC